ncbi:GH25 family lysozyme [Weizmannia sp. CD-2023]|uniref:GH25 family lysozyme n=1 Tax=Heyndrickxia TaxID=2837504 RepID=UPI002E1D4BFE|nr:GH25 family lysozyme [Weizmannia sp. CD-2023]MED4841532.1 GH25 family lysozyme [Weizmannia sp. CD-2023]MED4899759.1 GH25 family lysozyme [Weizmannia sp. CD-2023]
MQSRSTKNLKGIDVSHWQGNIDFKKVKDAGYKFVYIKLTDDSNYVDPNSDKNYRGAKKAGLLVGFYHFSRFRSIDDAKAEAAFYLQKVAKYDVDLPHVLDLEVNPARLSKASLSRCAVTWLETVKAKGGDVMVYTGASFANSSLDNQLRPYKLWIAHYGVNTPKGNPIWDKWNVFQYTSSGRVAGISGNVDLDEMTPETIKKVVTKNTPTEKTLTETKTKYKTYTIKSGDTLWELAQGKSYTVDDILKVNKGIDPKRLQVGQVINLPVVDKTATVKKSTTYTVKKGDTLSEIAVKFGVSLSALQKANPKVIPTKMQIGTKLVIPTGNSGGAISYTIKKGDTFWDIAQKYGCSVAEIQKLNPKVDPKKLQVGQKIKVPK